MLFRFRCVRYYVGMRPSEIQRTSACSAVRVPYMGFMNGDISSGIITVEEEKEVRKVKHKSLQNNFTGE